MSSTIIYKKELTPREELVEVKRMIGLLESIIHNTSHCEYALHKRSYLMFVARLEELKEIVANLPKRKGEEYYYYPLQ